MTQSSSQGALRIPEIDPALRARAVRGVTVALDTLARAIESGVYNLAIRMLGRRDDARRVTRMIIARVVADIASCDDDIALDIVVYRIAAEILLTTATHALESPALSFEAIDASLASGLAEFHPTIAPLSSTAAGQARDVALHCTQDMLLALDREHRLAYLLDVVLGLSATDLAAALDITPASGRDRVSSATKALHAFMQQTCGLVNEDARCRCHRQLPALRAQRSRASSPSGSHVLLPTVDDETLRYEQLVDLSAPDAVMRAAPVYAVPTD